jgi:predicted flap endonuclease-1-like 5' DNA nuclease
VGIRTTGRLLDAARNPRGRKTLAEETGCDEKKILCWANMADKMRIKGVGEEYAELLHAAGVDTVKDLKYRNPGNLAKALAAANAKRKLVRLLPSEKAVVRWIEHAKKLPLKITY